MSYCPSQDWDRHVNEMDDAMAERAANLVANRDQMLLIMAALLLRPDTVPPTTLAGIQKLLTTAEQIVSAWHYHCQPPE